MVNNIIRVIFCFVIMTITLSYSLTQEAASQGRSHILIWVLIPVTIAIIAVMMDMFWKKKKINIIAGLFFGTLSGLAIAFVLSTLVDLGAMLYGAPPEVKHPGARPTIPSHLTGLLKPDDNPTEDTNGASDIDAPKNEDNIRKKAPEINIVISDNPTESEIRQTKLTQVLVDKILKSIEQEKPDVSTVLLSMYIENLRQQQIQLRRNRAIHLENSVRNFLDTEKKYENQLASYVNYRSFVEKVHLLKLILGAFSVFACITIVMQTKDEFRFIVPYIEFSKQTKGTMPMLLDTSVIIDGRICDIIKTKIIQTQLTIPRFVLGELQAVADSQDKLKRNRGRRGLDVIHQLQTNNDVDIEIIDIHTPSIDNSPEVDAKLISLAQHLTARIMTNDYNLNKLATVRGVEVININELTNALKPVVLPGEKMAVDLIRAGEAPKQAVGYLDDGTMVVVEEGQEHIGHSVSIEVTSALQTSAGRMIFGRFDRETD